MQATEPIIINNINGNEEFTKIDCTEIKKNILQYMFCGFIWIDANTWAIIDLAKYYVLNDHTKFNEVLEDIRSNKRMICGSLHQLPTVLYMIPESIRYYIAQWIYYATINLEVHNLTQREQDGQFLKYFLNNAPLMFTNDLQKKCHANTAHRDILISTKPCSYNF